MLVEARMLHRSQTLAGPWAKSFTYPSPPPTCSVLSHPPPSKYTHPTTRKTPDYEDASFLCESGHEKHVLLTNVYKYNVTRKFAFDNIMTEKANINIKKFFCKFLGCKFCELRYICQFECRKSIICSISKHSFLVQCFFLVEILVYRTSRIKGRRKQNVMKI